MSTKILIELKQIYLDTDAGEPLFRNLSFALGAGESAVIIGPAGTGKSSLVDLMVGLQFPAAGTVEMFGEAVGRRRTRAIRRVRRRIGGIGGVFQLIPGLNVGDNVQFPLLLDSVPHKARRERLMKTLTDFALVKHAHQPVERLTRVQNTLVQFARASIANQPLIIIDEPTAGLDQATLASVMEHLERASFAGRSLVVLSSAPLPWILPNGTTFFLQDGALVT